ncbi:hypothetical protein ACIPPQ_15885 [Sphingopyxis sp. LARHCG72]
MTIVNAAFSTLCGRDKWQRKAMVSNWKYEEVVRLQDRLSAYSELIYSRFFQPQIFGPRDPGLTELRTHIWSRTIFDRNSRKTVIFDFRNRPYTADIFLGQISVLGPKSQSRSEKEAIYFSTKAADPLMALAYLGLKLPKIVAPTGGIMGMWPRMLGDGKLACCRFDGRRDKFIQATPASRSKSIGLR